MDKPPVALQDATNTTSFELDFRQLDPKALADLEDTALGSIVNELKTQPIGNTKHSSHSSYSAYSTYSMGPIG